MMIWALGVVAVAFVAALVFSAMSRRRLQDALSGLDDAQLEKLWLGPGLDGRQRGWIRAEMQRRGLDA